MPFNIIRNDIVCMEVDAIVNAANPELKQGGGVCGRIFLAAGELEIDEDDRRDACQKCRPQNWCSHHASISTFAVSDKPDWRPPTGCVVPTHPLT